jgi:hypothetical protein
VDIQSRYQQVSMLPRMKNLIPHGNMTLTVDCGVCSTSRCSFVRCRLDVQRETLHSRPSLQPFAETEGVDELDGYDNNEHHSPSLTVGRLNQLCPVCFKSSVAHQQSGGPSSLTQMHRWSERFVACIYVFCSDAGKNEGKNVRT